MTGTLGRAAQDLRDEAVRTAWLRGAGLPAAEVLECGEDERSSWLLTRALPGRSLAEPWPPALVEACLTCLAEVTRALHALADCLFVRDLVVMLPAAVLPVSQGLLDAEDPDDERRGRPIADLLDELLATVPPTQEQVVCHGDLCAPNVLFDAETGAVTGLVDLGRVGLADRHQDLALAARRLGDAGPNTHLGARAAGAFLRAYGGPVDPDLLAFYQLLDEFF